MFNLNIYIYILNIIILCMGDKRGKKERKEGKEGDRGREKGEGEGKIIMMKLLLYYII